LAESLAELDLPVRCVLIVLSQQGAQLEPLRIAGARTVEVPGLQPEELRLLAERRGVIPRQDTGDSQPSATGRVIIQDAEFILPFLAALSERSAGNALYATYICRELSGRRGNWTDPETFVRGLPPFDGLLEGYYRYLVTELGEAGSVADVLAVLDFSVSSEELRQIRPDMAHRIDAALSVLAPVLSRQVSQGGIRVYHESFARFLRKSFESDPSAMVANLERIAVWLDSRGFPEDDRAFGRWRWQAQSVSDG
jgi:hypothetical protein